MRQVGSLATEEQAQRFADYLVTLGVPAHAEPENSGWVIWVREENQLDQARDEFQAYAENPLDARYQGVEEHADTLRKEVEKKRAEVRKNTIEMRSMWNRPLAQRAPLVLTLIGLSVAVALASNFGKHESGSVMRSLAFVDRNHLIEPDWNGNPWVDIRGGQVWRLITPIFVHYGPAHIIFNMICLYYLGTRIEGRRGTWRLAVLVVVTAVISNVAQAVASGPWFGGMSGVVYGLFGYVWMKMLYQPDAGLAIGRDMVVIMVVWLLLGFSGILGSALGLHVANWAHGGGMLVGVAIGCAPDWIGKQKRH